MMDAVEKLIQHVELQIHWQDLCDKASTQRKVWLADIARLENEIANLQAALDSAPPYTAEELDVITNPRFDYRFRWSEYGKSCILTSDLVVPVSKNSLVLIDIHNRQIEEIHQAQRRVSGADVEFFCGDCGEKTVTRHRENCPKLAAALEGKT